MEPTVFHKILTGDIPAQIVAQNDGALAFMDITPIAPGHVIVIPKRAAGQNIYDTTADELAPVWALVQTLGPAVARAADAQGFNVIMNNKEAAGQRVFYPHVHIIPRREGDGLGPWPHMERSSDDIARDADRIRAALASS